MEKITLTLTEMSKYLGMSKKTLYNMIKDGRFPVPPIKGTNPRRWSVEEIKAWVREK